MNLTICGSLTYEAHIQEWHERLSFAGHTCYCMVVLPSQKSNNKDWYTTDQKQMLDLLHLSKIENADAVFVVDTNGYIGESTRREILWAAIREKPVFYASSSGDTSFLLEKDEL